MRVIKALVGRQWVTVAVRDRRVTDRGVGQVEVLARLIRAGYENNIRIGANVRELYETARDAGLIRGSDRPAA